MEPHSARVIQQVIVGEQQQGSPGLDQQDSETPHIKEEEEQLWISEEGEHFTLVCVKSEDEEKAPPSQLQQSHTEAKRAGGSGEQRETKAEDCAGSGPGPGPGPGPATSLRVLVKQRLTAAVEEILTLFETTLAEYEEKIYHLHSQLQHVKPGVLTGTADDSQMSRERDDPLPTPVDAEIVTETQVKAVDVSGMQQVNRLAEFLVGLRTETGHTLSSQQASTITALWQNLLPSDQQRGARFRRPGNTPALAAEGEDCVSGSTGSSAGWPGTCRLVDSIFVKLCNIHRSPVNQGHQVLSRWSLILRDYRKIAQLVLGNGGVTQNTTLQLFDVSQTDLIQWSNKRQAGLLQGAGPPAPEPLPPVQVRPTAAPPQPAQLQTHLPKKTAVKRKSAAPPRPHAPPPVHLRPPGQRQLFPKQTPPPTSAPLPVLAPAIGPFVFLASQVPVATPNAAAGPRRRRRPPVPGRRAYIRRVETSKCSRCQLDRNKDTGHSQYFGHVYCPQDAVLPLDQWKEEMRRRRKEKT